MSYLFSLCLRDDVEQSRDLPVVVGSFREIKQILNLFSKELDRKFVKYETEMVVADSKDKGFVWGETYRVIGVQSNGSRIPLGYCNFEKSWVNCCSSLDISTILMFVLALTGMVSSALNHNVAACLWAFIAFLWIIVVCITRHGMIAQKLMYLLK